MIKTLHLKGSPREIGFQHGSEGKEEVHHSLESYERFFEQIKGLSWNEAKEIALQHLDIIAKFDADLVEEMEGVAKGAGVQFEDILTLNTRSEIALTDNGKRMNDGCTSVAMNGSKTKDLIIGQTWDWAPSQHKSLLLTYISQQNKPDITMVTEGGIIGKIGFNNLGIGVCMNALVTDVEYTGLPIHVAMRGILNAMSYDEVMQLLDENRIGSTASLVIGADDGYEKHAVNFEVSPFGNYHVGGEDGWYAHTNHILSDTFLKKVNEDTSVIYEGSLHRKKRIDQLIEQTLQQDEVINENHFVTWFSDEVNKPYSINHHTDENVPEHFQIETLFSIIMNLSEKKALLRVGLEGEFKEI